MTSVVIPLTPGKSLKMEAAVRDLIHMWVFTYEVAHRPFLNFVVCEFIIGTDPVSMSRYVRDKLYHLVSSEFLDFKWTEEVELTIVKTARSHVARAIANPDL